MLRRVVSISEPAELNPDPEPAKIALSWTGEPGRVEELTHEELIDQSARVAAVLTSLGVRSGDRVAVHLPLVPESVIATLACGRIDAVRSTMPVSLRPDELAAQLRDSEVDVLITADAGFWNGSVRPIKALADRALATGGTGVRTVLVVNRCSRPVGWHPGRDHWWHEALADS